MLLSPAVKADFLSASDLSDACAAKKGSIPESICFAYIKGIADGLLLGQVVERKIYCPPNDGKTAGLSGDRARSLVEKYLRESSGKQSRPAALEVADALIKSFPCKK